MLTQKDTLYELIKYLNQVDLYTLTRVCKALYHCSIITHKLTKIKEFLSRRVRIHDISKLIVPNTMELNIPLLSRIAHIPLSMNPRITSCIDTAAQLASIFKLKPFDLIICYSFGPVFCTYLPNKPFHSNSACYCQCLPPQKLEDLPPNYFDTEIQQDAFPFYKASDLISKTKEVYYKDFIIIYCIDGSGPYIKTSKPFGITWHLVEN